MEVKKPKVLVFIAAGDIVQRFVLSGAFAEISEACELVYVLPDPKSEKAIKVGLGPTVPRIEYVAFDKARYEAHVALFDVSCRAFGHKSRSFRDRADLLAAGIKPNLGLEKLKLTDPLAGARVVVRVGRFLRKRAQLEWLKLNALPARYQRFRHTTLDRLGPNLAIAALFERERPDLVLLPSALMDIWTEDVLDACTRRGLKVAMLVSGWDNLSSKGLMQHRPTVMGVWGEQTRAHAIEIQGVPPESVVALGAPHYEALALPASVARAEFLGRLGLPTDRLILLFGGSLRTFDETSALERIEKAVESGLLPKLHVLYRPHPWRMPRQGEVNFFDRTWNHVTMDPAIAQAYRTNKDGNRAVSTNEFIFSMGYLNDLYRSIDCAVSPMSTLVLEAMVQGNPVLAVAFNDGKHTFSADQNAAMTHFDELRRSPGVIFCQRPEDFIADLQKIVGQAGDGARRDEIRKATTFFVKLGPGTYAARLAQLLSIGASAPSP